MLLRGSPALLATETTSVLPEDPLHEVVVPAVGINHPTAVCRIVCVIIEWAHIIGSVLIWCDVLYIIHVMIRGRCSRIGSKELRVRQEAHVLDRAEVREVWLRELTV